MQLNRLGRTMVAVAAFGAFLIAGSADASVLSVDTFETGTYPATGSGWLTDWDTTTADANVTDSLANASPLTGGSNNYVAVTTTATDASNNNIGTLGRQLDSDGVGVESIRFLFRVDDLPDDWATLSGDNATSRNNRFQIFTAPDLNAGTGPDNGWIIYGVRGGAFGADNDWVFHAGTKDGNFNAGTFVESDVPVILGHTYEFIIQDDIANSEYIATVSDLDDPGTTFTTGTLGYRASSLTEDRYLNFGGSTRGTNGSTTGFSIDNINIPEPTTAVLLGLLGGALLRRRRTRG